MMPVNKSGMGLQNPVLPAQETYTRSLCASVALSGEVTGTWVISNADNIQSVKG